MQKIIRFMEFYAPSILRYSMVSVILWFSIAQFSNASNWTAYIPASLVSITGISATVFVYLNAIFELVFSILLLFGWQTRIVALLLAAHLFDIMYVVGYGEIGVRDFGLAMGTLVVFMNGSDPLCIQHKRKFSPETINPKPLHEQPMQQQKRLI